jgi:hypothetical protein
MLLKQYIAIKIEGKLIILFLNLAEITEKLNAN